MMDNPHDIPFLNEIIVFLVVAALVVAIARMVRSSGEVFAQDVVSHRAFLAAESGAQLGLNRLFAPAGVGSCGNWTWDLTDFGLGFCEATVSCRTEVVAGVSYFTLESDGRCDPGTFVAERRVLVRAR